jgi:hypothetical protein
MLSRNQFRLFTPQFLRLVVRHEPQHLQTSPMLGFALLTTSLQRGVHFNLFDDKLNKPQSILPIHAAAFYQHLLILIAPC